MSKENNPQNEGLSDETKKVLEQMIAQRITRAEMARDKALEEQRKEQIPKCISCDAEITEDAKFCSSCGASQIQEPQTIADEDEEETPLVPNFQRLKIAHRIVIGFCIIAILGIIVTVSEGNTDGMLSLGIGVFFTLVYFISTFGSIKDITNDIFTDSKLLPIGLKICGYISGFFAVIIAAMVLIMPYIFIGISNKVNQPIEWDWSMLLIVTFIAVPFSMLYYLYHSFKILTYVDLMEVEYEEEQAHEGKLSVSDFLYVDYRELYKEYLAKVPNKEKAIAELFVFRMWTTIYGCCLHSKDDDRTEKLLANIYDASFLGVAVLKTMGVDIRKELGMKQDEVIDSRLQSYNELLVSNSKADSFPLLELCNKVASYCEAKPILFDSMLIMPLFVEQLTQIKEKFELIH